MLFVHSTKQSVLVQNLHPNTRYEFVVRLHVDQMSSPWSSVVYHQTLPAGKILDNTVRSFCNDYVAFCVSHYFLYYADSSEIIAYFAVNFSASGYYLLLMWMNCVQHLANHLQECE